jgi:aryl-alcohol dehydrogenase-like predicted oxidoreductase
MEKRRLGNSGLAIAPLALGGNVFGWTADEPTSFAVLDAFVAAGFNFIDTADLYSAWAPGNQGGESETIIGNWLARRGGCEKVFIATKVGWNIAPDRKGLSRNYILKAVEGSLQRLRTDYIDLYQTHIDDAATPLEETLEAYARLVEHGKVRAIGASNLGAPRLRASLEVSDRLGYPRYHSFQPHYNLCDRAQFEGEVEELCIKEKLGVITYFSLASGFLTGKYRSQKDLAGRARADEVKKYVNERGLRILKTLDEVAARCNATLAQVALAWLLSRPSVTAPIASATSVAQLTNLIRATELKLDRDAIDALDRASAS